MVNSRLDTAEQRISEFEDRARKIHKLKHREKKMKKQNRA